MTNKELRAAIQNAGLKNWQIAETIGVSEFSFSRWWRHDPLPPARQRMILDAVKELTDTEGGGHGKKTEVVGARF